MSLELKVNEQIKEAMLAKEKVRLESLRAIKAGILLAKTAEGGNGEVTDDQVVKLIQKMVKQRKESADIYKQQNRPELAENELAEISYMEVFLPKQLSGEELEAALKAIVERVGAKLLL